MYYGVYEIVKTVLILLVAFVAPYWFPLTERIFNGGSLSGVEWLCLCLLLVIPVVMLIYGERENRKERIKEIKKAMREVLELQKAIDEIDRI